MGLHAIVVFILVVKSIRRQTPRLVLAVLVSVLTVWLSSGSPQQAGAQAAEVSEENSTGALKGKVCRGPLSPVEGVPDIYHNEEPASGVKIRIFGSDGEEVESTDTNELGEYEVSLPEGSYRVKIELTPGEVVKDLPAEVAIETGEPVRLDIRIDTGIR